MTTYRRLRRLFENISFAALAAQASGCSDTSLNSGFDLTVPCDEPSVLAGAQQVVAGDYLAIRRAYLPNLDGAPPPPPYMVAEAGVACATASEPDACATALATIPADPGWGHDVVFWPETHRARTQLIWTRGDEVGAVTNDAELRAFFQANRDYFRGAPRVHVRRAGLPDTPLSPDKLEQYLGARVTREVLALEPGATLETPQGRVELVEKIPGREPRFDEKLVRAEYSRRAGEQRLRAFFAERRARARIVTP